MSVPVPIHDLAAALERFDSGFLLSTTGGKVKVVTVDPVCVDGVLRIGDPGRGTAGNIAENPAVTLAFSPRKPHDHALLIDGTATLGADGAVVVQPETAVLHRPAAHAGGAPATECGQDCRPV